MMAAIMEKGPGYAKGSFQSLVDAFVAAIEQNGGELLLDSRVTAIPIEDGRVAGVVLEDGRAIRSEQVISAIDAKQTLEELVGLDRLPDRLVRRYRRMKPSLSAFVIYAATTLDVRELDLAHETFVYRSWDHEEDFRNVLEHRVGGSWLSLPTLHDPSVAPEGEHLVVFTIFTPYDIGTPWEEARERYTQLLVDEVEALMPGFRDNMTYLDAATPLTFERYTSNQQGAVYGWENTPQQSQPKRLQHRLPIEGLFLAGHWTEPGSSSFRVVYSGLQAASSALGYESSVEFMGALYGQPV
jgi:prolycopene isomerase